MLAVAISPHRSMAVLMNEATLSRKLSHRRITPFARFGRVLVAEHQVESSLWRLNSYSHDFVSQPHVGLAAGPLLDGRGIDDEHLRHHALQQGVQRFPVTPGALLSRATAVQPAPTSQSTSCS